MPKRISIQPHLSIEELEDHYRHAKELVERTHYQIIWLLAQGKPTEEVAAVTSYSLRKDLRIGLGLQPDWSGKYRGSSTSKSRGERTTAR